MRGHSLQLHGWRLTLPKGNNNAAIIALVSYSIYLHFGAFSISHAIIWLIWLSAWPPHGHVSLTPPDSLPVKCIGRDQDHQPLFNMCTPLSWAKYFNSCSGLRDVQFNVWRFHLPSFLPPPPFHCRPLQVFFPRQQILPVTCRPAVLRVQTQGWEARRPSLPGSRSASSLTHLPAKQVPSLFFSTISIIVQLGGSFCSFLFYTPLKLGFHWLRGNLIFIKTQ